MGLKDLLENPRTAPFSRLKYLQRFASEEEVAEFLNGLFNVAAEARYGGHWDLLEAFLDRLGGPRRRWAVPKHGDCRVRLSALGNSRQAAGRCPDSPW